MSAGVLVVEEANCTGVKGMGKVPWEPLTACSWRFFAVAERVTREGARVLEVLGFRGGAPVIDAVTAKAFSNASSAGPRSVAFRPGQAARLTKMVSESKLSN